MRLYLCLDLATCTGYAIGGPGRDCEPVSGAIQLQKRSDRDVGGPLIQFRDWLDAMIEAEKPTDIIFEQPILTKTGNLHTARRLYSLAAMTEVAAIEHRIPVRELSLAKIRKNTIGHVRAPSDVPKSRRSAWMKQKTMEWARSRGWSPKNADAADALAVYHTIRCFDDPSYAASETPLFGGVA